MKKLLSSLMMLVFLQTQSWALSGGPVFSNDVQSISGTFSGVMVGSAADAASAGLGTTLDSGSNSLGIFVLGVPAEGSAQGAMVIFIQGSFFQGGMIGVVDPGEGQLTALAQAGRVLAKSNGDSGSSVFFDARADGSIQADIKQEGFAGLRLEGDGIFTVKELDLNTFEFHDRGTLHFEVTGFKQSTTVVTPDANSVAGLLNS